MRRKLILPIFDKYEDIIDEATELVTHNDRWYLDNINANFPFCATMFFDSDISLKANILFNGIEICSSEVNFKKPNGIPTKAEYNRCIKKLQNAYKEWVNNLYEVKEDETN